MLKKLIASLALLPALVFADSVDVSSGWARASVPGSENGAAYATIKNTSQQSVTINKVTSSVSDKAEVHRHVMSGEMMKMEHVKPLVMSPGEELTFQPGGYHFMLFGLDAPLTSNQTFSLTLHFDSNAQQKIEITVQ